MRAFFHKKLDFCCRILSNSSWYNFLGACHSVNLTISTSISNDVSLGTNAVFGISRALIKVPTEYFTYLHVVVSIELFY